MPDNPVPVLAWPFVALIWVYRVTLSPLIGGHCRFDPTCSQFGLDAYKRYGACRGTLLTTRRILRCHPFSAGGYDPVPIQSQADPTPDPTQDQSEPDHHEQNQPE